MTWPFKRDESSKLVCPRCERELSKHDDAACQRGISRRFFFGVSAGAVAAIVVAPRIPTGGLFDPVTNLAQQYASEGGVSARYLASYDISKDLWLGRLDILYGTAPVTPEHGGREVILC